MKLLYLEGDRCSRKYLLGAFHALDITVDDPMGPPTAFDAYDITVLSDFTAERLGASGAESLAGAIDEGVGLLMVGGWTSFGRGGYAATPLAQVLPIEMMDGDDRRALPTGAHPTKLRDHAALAELDWARPPVLCGMNRLRAKPGADVVLELQGEPLLVAGHYGQGRTLAYAGDLAPHWSGGLTDWGSATVPGPEGEEMGTDYVEFLGSMLRWAARQELGSRTRSRATVS